RQLPVRDLGQQVGQNRQRLPAFDDVDHLRERLQESFALQAETHAWDSCGKASGIRKKLEKRWGWGAGTTGITQLTRCFISLFLWSRAVDKRPQARTAGWGPVPRPRDVRSCSRSCALAAPHRLK